MPAVIKSIQRVEVHISPTSGYGGHGADVTITAVDPTKTILLYVGQTSNGVFSHTGQYICLAMALTWSSVIAGGVGD